MKTTPRIIFPLRGSALKSLNRLLVSLQVDKPRKYFILTDENTLNHCMPALICSCPVLEEAEFLELPAGEECKSPAIILEVWQSLLSSGAGRDSVILNLGGGCLCDSGGFVAATYQRGIDYINIPTSLVAMVDAAIGGKTAINIDSTKNQVGCFHSPIATCIEPVFLDTLPERERRNGEYEIMKTLLLTGFESWSTVFSALGSYENLIRQCVEFKASVVRADYKEQGIRKILNFGHTFGHAIESFSLYSGKSLSHGEAVGIGMLCALYLSEHKLGLSHTDYQSYKDWLTQRITLPRYSLRDTESILSYMRHDKKNSGGSIQCVLLQAPGLPVIDIPVPDVELRDALLKLI